MIISIPILDPGPCQPLVDEMLRIRARVFKDILDWDVQVDENGFEVDEFDTLPGTYLVSVDDRMRVQASLRLLPTTGAYMVSDVFGDLLGTTEPPRSLNIWESSRFCARPAEDHENVGATRYWASSAFNEHVVKLMCGLAVYAQGIGVSHIVSLFDVRVERLLRSMGAGCQRLNEPGMVGNTRAVAGLFETNLDQAAPKAKELGIDLRNLVTPASAIKLPKEDMVEAFSFAKALSFAANI